MAVFSRSLIFPLQALKGRLMSLRARYAVKRIGLVTANKDSFDNGKPKPLPARDLKRKNYKYLDRWGEPYAIYTFRYRSLSRFIIVFAHR